MNEPNKHHFLPVFYLKQWAGADGRLTQFHKPYGHDVKANRKHPDGTGYIKRLYEISGLPDKMAMRFEREYFSPADSQAANALKAIYGWHEGYQWPRNLRQAWTRFLMSLLFRMPEDIRKLKHIARYDFPESDPELHEEYLKIRDDSDPPTLADYLRTAPQSVYDEIAMDAALKMMDNSAVGTGMMNMRWSTCHFPDMEFLTSDRPIVMTDVLNRPDSHLVLPVGPHRVFLAVHDRKHAQQIWAIPPKHFVTMINISVVEQANEYVYGPTDAQLRFVQNRMGKHRVPSPIDRLTGIVDVVKRDDVKRRA